MLIRPCSVVNNGSGKVFRPCRNDIEQQGFLNVDEHRKFIAGERNSAMRKTVDLAGDLVDGHKVVR